MMNPFVETINDNVNLYTTLVCGEHLIYYDLIDTDMLRIDLLEELDGELWVILL